MLTFIDTKGNICYGEFLMLLMDRNFNPFAISIKQADIINGNINKLHYGAVRFSLTQVSL